MATNSLDLHPEPVPATNRQSQSKPHTSEPYRMTVTPLIGLLLAHGSHMPSQHRVGASKAAVQLDALA